MKIPKARKLPSGNWFIQLRIDGQSISITEADEKTCVAKAMAYKAGILKAKKSPGELTLSQAVDRYIEARSNSLSPSTIRGYRTIQKTRFSTLMPSYLASFNQNIIQRAINREADLCNAKTLTNAWSFVSSVIYEATSERYNVSLPPVVPNEHPFLTPEQIPIFLEAIKGSAIEIPALLGLLSLRRSEILGLKWDNVDIKNRLVYVSGSSVINENNELVNKPTNKNTTSRRVVPMTARLAELLDNAERVNEFVVNCNANNIWRQVNKICKNNGLPLIGTHGLRHSFASLAYYLKMPEKTAMKIGGWANETTMKKIYTHISEKQVAEESAKLLEFFDGV